MGQASKTRFQNPPVIEVVFQVMFPTITGIGPPHFGLFWSSIRDEFPTLQSAPRLGPIDIQQIKNAFPENRLWLVHKSNETIIQLQDNRFLFNWRAMGEEHSYPGYDDLYPQFRRYLEQFCEYVDSENVPIESFTGFDLHYINHIYLNKTVRNWEDAGNVLTPFNKPGVDRNSFPLKSLSLSTVSDIPGSDNRLTVAIESKTHNITKKELLNYEMRVSGNRENMSLESMDSEFSTAHDQMLEAFLNLSTSKVRREWGSK